MTDLIQKIADFLRSFWPLFTVLAWERAVRVRFGRNIALLEPGVHFRVPFFDTITLFNNRLRVLHTDPQTLTTADGAVLTVSVTIGFRITDPLAAAMRHHAPEYAIRSVALGMIADAVIGRARSAITPGGVASEVLAALRASGGGYEYDICAVSDFGYVKTYRLLNSQGSQGWSIAEERKL